jgi:hypothetical protein
MKSLMLRVARAAPRARQMAAIWASNPAIGGPALSRCLDQRIVNGASSVKGQHIVAECGEKFVRRHLQAILPAPAGEACQATANLGDRDRRCVQLSRRLPARPAADSGDQREQAIALRSPL